MALDPSYAFYDEGTITVTNGSDIATGDMTAWDPAVLPWDFVFPNDGTAGLGVIKEVLAMDQIRLAKPWTGPTLTNVPYTMVRWTRHTDPRIYAVRVSEYLTRLKEIPAGAIEEIQAAADQIIADAIEAINAGTVLDNAVTNAKLADMAPARIKGRATVGTGDPEDLTGDQVKTIIGSASETATGVIEIATQAEADAGTDDARAVTPKKLRAGFAVSLATTGYIAFPSWMGGLIIQWGTTVSTCNPNGNAPVTWPLAFPTAVYTVIGATGDPAVSGNETAGVLAPPDLTKTLGYFAFRPNPGAVARRINWIAIGR